MNQFDATKDYYAIIGARAEDSQREIERLYKKAAHKTHPDRGGNDEDMKTLNEAYRVLRDHETRNNYDLSRKVSRASASPPKFAAAAREVGIHGQALSALLCLVLGTLLLFLVRFNGLWFLWPLSILAVGVICFGVLIAHAAMGNAREGLAAGHPARRFRLIQELVFWSLVGGGGLGIYLILTWV